jgi:hypothetical protein
VLGKAKWKSSASGAIGTPASNTSGWHAQLSPNGGNRFRAELDGDDLPVDQPDARELEIAIKKVIDET